MLAGPHLVPDGDRRHLELVAAQRGAPLENRDVAAIGVDVQVLGVEVADADPHQPAVYDRNPPSPERVIDGGSAHSYGPSSIGGRPRARSKGEKYMRQLDTDVRRPRPMRSLAALLAVLALLGIAAVGGRAYSGTVTPTGSPGRARTVPVGANEPPFDGDRA